MATRHAVLPHLPRLVNARPSAPNSSDRQLLERFTHQRDEDAFQELVRRHGSLVHSVCRRVLSREHDIEDAFQATFLVLAEKAGSIRRQSSLASWLHGVAYRSAARIRTQEARRRRHEQQAVTGQMGEPDLTWREVQQVLDQELERLPEHYRLPLLLCYLEGKTQCEAARELGWGETVLRGRLDRGRARLRGRLARRGVTLSAALFAVGLTQGSTSGAVPADLVHTTVQAALTFPHSTGPATVIARAVLRTMVVGRIKVGIALTLVFTLLTAGVGLLGQAAFAPPSGPLGEAKTRSRESEKKPAADPLPLARLDRHGDPLPDGAIARLGTARLRHGDQVLKVAFSPDGKTLASVSWDHTVSLWEVSTGKLLRMLHHTGQVACVVFTPDGKTLISGGSDAIRLWDVKSGRLLHQLPHGGWVWSLALSPDGKTLAYHASNIPVGRIELRDVKTGARRGEMTFDDVRDGIMTLAFSPDGKKMITGGDRVLRLWDVTTRKQLKVFGKGGQTYSVAYSPDGKVFAVGRHDSNVHLYDAVTAKEVQTLPGHEASVYSLAFSADGKRLLTGSNARTARLWDLASGKVLREFKAIHPGRLWGVALSPDGKTVAAASEGSTVHLWDVDTGKDLHPFKSHSSWITHAAFVDGDKTVLSLDTSGAVSFWDPASGRQQRSFQVGAGYSFCAGRSPDGHILAVGLGQGIDLFDLATGKKQRHLKGHERQTFSTVFSPRGEVLASTAYRDRSIRLWDVATGKEQKQIRTRHQNQPRCLAFSPDGKTLASGGEYDRSICLWELPSGKLLRQWTACDQGEPLYQGLSALAFSPDGSLLASSGADKTVQLWDVATGQSRGTLRGHERGYGKLAFSPDGRMLASGTLDSTVRLWELATGRERCRFQGHRGQITALAFSTDGQRLVSGSMDTGVIVWDVTAQVNRPSRTGPLSARELDRLGNDLAGRDARRAYQAICTLAAVPEQSLPWLGKRLRLPSLDGKQVERWIADLDSESFAVRTRATRELEQLGGRAKPALGKALAGNPGAEARRRLKALLDRLDGFLPPGEDLRLVRVIEVLERIGTPRARQLLEQLHREMPASRVGREAKASLERLAKHP
jgi:RNA polymerase sigma factor (sigma-70 family)